LAGFSTINLTTTMKEHWEKEIGQDKEYGMILQEIQNLEPNVNK
jgi:hypothetical protein